MKFYNDLSYGKKSVLLVILFTSIRVILCSAIELGSDESYYWTYSQHLQWNYFDHPPLIAIWIRLFTLNLWLQDYTFFLRLGSLVSCAISSYFIYKTIDTIDSKRTAFIGVFLYNTSFYASITAGLFVMPDTPQMVFWTCSMYLITQIFNNEKRWLYWILLGISIGLCIMSKVHGVFLWGGIFLYVFFYKKNWFLLPQFYISILLTAMVCSPILLWNIQNDFITYRFHSQRVTINDTKLHWLGLLKEWVGELIVNNPFNIFIIAWFVFSKKIKNAPVLTVFKFIALPLLLIIWGIALFRQALPHWSGPAYITLIPIAAIGLSRLHFNRFKKISKWLFFYCLIFVFFIIVAVAFYPGTFGNKQADVLGKGDISLDSFGWKEASKKFALLYNDKFPNQLSTNKVPLICNSWWGAHEEYFFARPLKINMIGLGSVQDLHNYDWKNKKAVQYNTMDTALCIVHSDEFYDPKKVYAPYYTNIDSIATIEVMRNKKPAHKFYIYVLNGWKK